MPSFEDRSTSSDFPDACVCVRTRAMRSATGSSWTDSSAGASPKSCALTNRAAMVSISIERRSQFDYSPYASLSSSSCSCVPCSTIAPSAITAMLLAFRIVESLCAMTIVVRCLETRSSACCTIRSAPGSNADVASSRSSTLGSDTMLRAIAMRCFWPPDRFDARSPRRVS
jgi:hypothetical protein